MSSTTIIRFTEYYSNINRINAEKIEKLVTEVITSEMLDPELNRMEAPHEDLDDDLNLEEFEKDFGLLKTTIKKINPYLDYWLFWQNFK